MTHASHNNDPYARIAALYDLEHDPFAEDLDFYLHSIESVGDPVLELGCGSGRLVRPIAAAGWRISGLDRSAVMLDRLRASIAGAPYAPLIAPIEADMTQADTAPGGPFGVVIFGLNSLMHLADPERQMAALRAAQRALDPRGQLLLDIMNPTLDALRALVGVSHEGTWQGQNGSVVDKFSARRVVSSEQLIQTRIWYDETQPDGRLRRTAAAFDLRYLHRHELELMLRAAGFVEWQIYGGYELEPYDEGADRLLVAAEPGPAAPLDTGRAIQ